MSQRTSNLPDFKPLTVLKDCLLSHDIIVSHRELDMDLSARQQAAVEKWITTYLAPDTLLTKEELSLYLALESSRECVALAESHDLSLVIGVDDCAIESAIDELKRSTTHIEKQTKTLCIQQDTMASLNTRNEQIIDARRAMDRKQSGIWASDNTELDERIQSLKYQVSELETHCRATNVGLRKTAVESLRSDDKLLLGLQALTSNTEPATNINGVAAQRVRDLCTRLIKFTVEAVRARLDRVYIGNTNGKLHGAGDVTLIKNFEVAALLEELESLYTEILPVAQMSAEQQYLAPALRLISLNEDTGRARVTRTMKYVSRYLSEIMSRLEELNTHALKYEIYRGVTTTLINTIKSEINQSNSSSPKVKAGSPSRIRKPNKPMSPIRPRSTRRRSSATSFDDDINPEQQLFRNFGLSLNLESEDEHTIMDALRSLLKDRTTKLNGNTRALQEVSESSIASHLHDSQVTLQLIMESLFSETPYTGMNLRAEDTEEGMSNLTKSIEEVRGRISAIDLERMKERSVSRDELIRRWVR